MSTVKGLPCIRVISGIEAEDIDGLFKKLVLELSEMSSVQNCGLSSEKILEYIRRRESQLSNMLGNGLIFPHARFPELQELSIVIASLTPPMNADTPDQHPLEIVCMLLIPAERPMEALKFMARFAGCIQDETLCGKFKTAIRNDDRETLFSMLDLEQKKTLTADDIMRKPDCFTSPEVPLKDATKLMQEKRASVIPVLDGNKLLGQISCTDLFRLGIPDFFSQLKSVGFIRYFDPFDKYFSVEARALVKDVMDTEVCSFLPESTLIEIVFAISVQKHPLVYVINSDRELLGVIDQALLLERIINL